MTGIEDLRRKIDAADDKIVAALNERFALAAEMRALKRRLSLPPVDHAREQAIFRRLLEKVDPAERDTLYGIYERIFSGSRGVVETIARGVAIQKGKVLLCRAKGASPTYLPGGHIEFGETGRTALVREVKEELGVGSTAGRFLGVVESSFIQHGRRHCEINLVYALEVEGAFPIESQEDWIEFEWRDLSDLPSANLLPAEMSALVRSDTSV